MNSGVDLLEKTIRIRVVLLLGPDDGRIEAAVLRLDALGDPLEEVVGRSLPSFHVGDLGKLPVSFGEKSFLKENWERLFLSFYNIALNDLSSFQEHGFKNNLKQCGS